MNLSKEGLALAKQIAKKLCVVSDKNEEQLIGEIGNFILTIKNVWRSIEKTVREVCALLNERGEKIKWNVPLKINPPPMPDFELPKTHLARSNL